MVSSETATFTCNDGACFMMRPVTNRATGQLAILWRRPLILASRNVVAIASDVGPSSAKVSLSHLSVTVPTAVSGISLSLLGLRTVKKIPQTPFPRICGTPILRAQKIKSVGVKNHRSLGSISALEMKLLLLIRCRMGAELVCVLVHRASAGNLPVL